MNTFQQLGLEPGRAICYSGFRDGQHPGGLYPSYDEVSEDLNLLHGKWKYLRLFDCDQHGETVLEVIEKENLDFKIMLGSYIEAELNNFNCPWNGGVYSKEQLEKNSRHNLDKVKKLAVLANRYTKTIYSINVGNEDCVDWKDHYVHEDRVLEFVRMVQDQSDQPVTFCENYAPWLYKIEKLANGVDFISIHTYPVWEYKHIDEALDYTKENYYSVSDKYPDTPVVITEAGWATNSNGRGIPPDNVNEEFQKIYFEKLMAWSEKENILTFFFEAFDEPWKGSPEPLEPEKHWGLYKLDRTPKLVLK